MAVTSRRERALQVFLVVWGLLTAGASIYLLVTSLLALRPTGGTIAPMFHSVFATLGVFLVLAAPNPSAHRSLIAFTVWSSVAHAAVMTLMAIQLPNQRGELLAEVAITALPAVLLCGREIAQRGGGASHPVGTHELLPVPAAVVHHQLRELREVARRKGVPAPAVGVAVAQREIIVSHAHGPREQPVEQLELWLPSDLGEQPAREVGLGAAVENLVARRRDQRHAERVVPPVFDPAIVHDVFVGGCAVVFIAVEARGHRQQVLQRHRALAWIEIGRNGAEHGPIDGRIEPEWDGGAHRRADQRRCPALGRRTEIMRLVATRTVEILFEHEFAVPGDQQAMDLHGVQRIQ